MTETLGQRIAALRKKKGMTQEALAEAMGVSSQAVSKWENDISCPDVLALPKLAHQLDVTVDYLLSGDQGQPVTRIVPKEELKPAEQRIMRIVVNSGDGDKVRVNLPLGMINAFMQAGVSMGSLQMGSNDALNKIDFAQVLALADQGLIGKMVEVESSDGDVVEIWVE